VRLRTSIRPAQEVGRLNLDGCCQLFQGRDPGIALASLDSTYLSRLDATSVGELFLGQTEPFARGAKISAEVPHGGDRPT